MEGEGGEGGGDGLEGGGEGGEGGGLILFSIFDLLINAVPQHQQLDTFNLFGCYKLESIIINVVDF